MIPDWLRRLDILERDLVAHENGQTIFDNEAARSLRRDLRAALMDHAREVIDLAMDWAGANRG